MTTPKFTPGPWKVIGDYDTLIRGPGLRDVATANVVGRIQLAEGQANARLIAAAPEMYEAIKRLLDLRNDDPGPWEDDPKTKADMDFVRAALAKAEGR